MKRWPHVLFAVAAAALLAADRRGAQLCPVPSPDDSQPGLVLALLPTDDASNDRILHAEVRAIAALDEAHVPVSRGAGNRVKGVRMVRSSPRRVINDELCRHLRAFTAIEEFELTSDDISDDGLAHIAGLTSLKTLRLGSNNITDKGLVYLARLSNLEELEFAYCTISDAGLKHLRTIPRLKRLYVGQPTRLTDAGLEELKYHRKLQRLVLRSTDISDNGLKQLQSLKGLQYLEISGDNRRVQLKPNLLTDAGLIHLKKITSLGTIRIWYAPVVLRM